MPSPANSPQSRESKQKSDNCKNVSKYNDSLRGHRTKNMAITALMVALALIFSYIEAIIPYNPGIPGVKLGIANIVTLIALYLLSTKHAWAVSVIRVLIAGLLFNGVFAAVYSLAGAIVSLTGMILLKKSNLFSIAGVSMAGGVLHNMGQLIMAALLLQDSKIFLYFPVLLFSGMITGIIIGLGASVICQRIRVSAN
jgi:heptaprenyl diphosphate synthase